MAYRNGTYVAFHAGGTTDPTASDIKYYNIMKAWDANDSIAFTFSNSHDKTSAVRDSSMYPTLITKLKQRLNNSKNIVLIITSLTKKDTDGVPFEVRYGVDRCSLPIIAAYPGYNMIQKPAALSNLWPIALKTRIEKSLVDVIHIPFAKNSVFDAISQFTVHSGAIQGGYNFYDRKAHQAFGLIQ
jgi:hypothetical protein